MTYTFPPSLHPLRDYMRGLGADTIAFASARQAAFMAQQLLGTRVKFPPAGADMTSTMFLIQKAVTEGEALKSTADQILRQDRKPKGKKQKGVKSETVSLLNKHQKDFSPAVFAAGVHIFCDGAAVPNPGVGGWGFAVYRDGVETNFAFGGDEDTTNNKMELMGLLCAISWVAEFAAADPVTIWCDSQYCVRGINDWRHGWKKNGWQRGSDKAEPHNRILANADLWKAIDEAIGDILKPQGILIKWCKGHNGIAGNERADELAEMGRQAVAEKPANLPVYDLDERYRQIMGAL